MAGDSSLSDRGVLTTQETDWQLAVRRAEVIGPLAQLDRVSVPVVEEAAALLGVTQRQVYALVNAGALVRVWRRICCQAAHPAGGAGNGSVVRSRRSCAGCCGRGICLGSGDRWR